MSTAIWFWIGYAAFVFFYLFPNWPAPNAAGGRAYWPFAGHVLLVILIGLLGWAQFGPPINNGSGNRRAQAVAFHLTA